MTEDELKVTEDLLNGVVGPRERGAHRLNEHTLVEIVRKTLREPAGWCDISTAPKDGTLIDVWADGVRVPATFWNAPQDSWATRSWRRSKRGSVHLVTTSHVSLTPTHWRPLPPAPPPEGAR